MPRGMPWQTARTSSILYASNIEEGRDEKGPSSVHMQHIGHSLPSRFSYHSTGITSIRSAWFGAQSSSSGLIHISRSSHATWSDTDRERTTGF